MLKEAQAYFKFLVEVYRIKPRLAKDVLDKWFLDCYRIKTTPEFNKWYYDTYPYEAPANKHK